VVLCYHTLCRKYREVYPGLSGDDLTYNGITFGVYVKMTGTYWEGPILTDLAGGVDLFLPDLPDDLVNAIYTKVYPSAYQAYRAKPAASNWGNLWNTALATFATMRCGSLCSKDTRLPSSPSSITSFSGTVSPTRHH